MASSSFTHTKITAISVVVPPKEVRLEDELFYFDGDAKKARRMTKMTGIDRRRIADPETTASDLCCQAAENLFAGLDFDEQTKASIDALIFISQQPDYFFPATACVLQHRLGLSKQCAAFDVNQGCTAYTYGLWLASSLVESGAVRRVLLLAGDTPSKLAPDGNRIVAPIFGDAGSATLLEYSKIIRPSWFELGSDGSGYESLIIPGGAARLPVPQNPASRDSFCGIFEDVSGQPWSLLRTYMNGGAIFDFTLREVPETISNLLRHAGLPPEEVDLLVLHQANRQIVEAITEKVGFPLDKSPSGSLSKYGNLAGCSIPGALCDLAEQETFPATRVLLSGFGVGLSWASGIVSLEGTWNSGVRNYIKPDGQHSLEDLRVYWQNKISGKDILR